MECSWTLQPRQEKPLPSLHKINRKDQNLRLPATIKTADPAQLPGPAAKITKARRDIVCNLSKKGAAGRRRRRRRRNRKMLLPATGNGGVSVVVVVVVGVVSLATAGVADAISAPASFFFTSLIKSKNMNSESKEETQNQLPFFHSKKRKQTNAPNLLSVPLPRPCLFSLSLSLALSLSLSLRRALARCARSRPQWRKLLTEGKITVTNSVTERTQAQKNYSHVSPVRAGKSRSAAPSPPRKQKQAMIDESSSIIQNDEYFHS
jgi:hypothetical protein